MTNDYKVPFLTKFSYGTGSVASGVKETAFNVFLLFFYTQVAGLPGTLAGTAIFIALVLDAISDPLIGYWSDRFKSAWGRRHPFIYFSAVPMGVGFYFLFHPPMGGSDTQLFLWMLSWAVLVRFFMTFFTVPAGALTAEMTNNYDERTSLAGYRVLFGWLGGLIFATISYAVFFAPNDNFADGRLDPTAYESFAWLGATLIVVTILICAIGTHGQISRLKEVAQRAGDSLGFRKDLSNFVHNKPFLILGGMLFVSAAAIGFGESIGLYMYTYFWGLTTDQLVLLTLSSALGTLIAFFVAPVLSKSYDKRPIAGAGIVVLMSFYPSLIGLRLLGVLPENGDSMMVAILMVNAAVVVFAAVMMTILYASMIADTVDVNELLTGRRQEGIYTSAFTFSLKAVSGIGGFIAGLTLDLISFPSGVEVGEVAQPTLNLMGGVVAGALVTFWCFAFLILRKYPLTRAEHNTVLDTIARRRESSSSESDRDS